MVKVGSKWVSSDMQEFTVIEVEERDDGVWVTYTKHGQDRAYSCLVDAFTNRFAEHVN